jgi:menaquinone-dependent protoporphyrinogen oxidase
MRVLVTYATRHESTAQIAEAIGHVLSTSEATSAVDVDVLPLENVDDLNVDDYDAVVLGSAIYEGRWLRSARLFVRANAEELARRPVWFFSSGPIGEPAVPDTDVREVAALAELVQARGHQIFAGHLRLADLALVERAAVRLVHAAEGDYRDFDSIRAWAADVAGSLTTSASA